jgi:exopolysaccharide biosynthesis polyprenyl glycosylphosphotransferase
MDMKLPKSHSRKSDVMSIADPSGTGPTSTDRQDYMFYGVTHFQHMLRIERKRTERSKEPFLLMLLDISGLLEKHPNSAVMEKIHSILSSCFRETDIKGWYNENRVIGIIFTQMSSVDEHSLDSIFRKLNDRCGEKLDPAWIKKIAVSFHIYPETKGSASVNGQFNVTLYPDINKKSVSERLSVSAKSMIDFIGSLFAIIIFSPIFLIIAAAIKIDSQGPVFFRQKRLGINGKPFDVMKFRSMKTNADSNTHKDYIEKYIHEQNNAAIKPGVYKLTNDSRITKVGNFIRKTSLDELPQFINVLKGDMSLVGPRPPIPYEYDIYDIWHRRRLLSCKPGITGLWQITGRSRTTFDEMVRLDLRYISEWSLWLDLKIIFKTPRAVLGGKGAY